MKTSRAGLGEASHPKFRRTRECFLNPRVADKEEEERFLLLKMFFLYQVCHIVTSLLSNAHVITCLPRSPFKPLGPSTVLSNPGTP